MHQFEGVLHYSLGVWIAETLCCFWYGGVLSLGRFVVMSNL